MTGPAGRRDRPYRLGIVIPTFNEAERLPPTLEAVAAARPGLPDVRVEHVLVADNGSSDGTPRLAQDVAAGLGLPLSVDSTCAGGKGGTLRQAIPALVERMPELDGVLFMDADDATDLSQLRAFHLDGPPCIWIGSRYLPGSQVDWLHGHPSLARRVLSRGMRVLTKWTLRLPEHDTQCGFKLVPARWAGPLFGPLRTEGWTFDAELLARAHRAGIPVREAPIRWVEKSGSKVRPLVDAPRSLLELVRIRVWLARESR